MSKSKEQEVNEMPDEEKQELENQNGGSTDGELEAIKAELQEEQAAKVALEGLIAERDARIAQVEGQLGDITEQLQGKTKELEDSATRLADVTAAADQAVSKYLGVAKALNPNVPEGIIAGATIEEIDASVEKGKGIVDAVKKAMESEAAAGKVPAGAPPRETISTEGMSPREKIAAGIKPKGGS